MFCKNCGANVADNTVFCPQCGTNLAIADDEQTMALGANNAAPAPQQPAQPQSAAYTPDVPTYVPPQQAQEPQADYTPDEPTFAAVSQQPTAPQAPQAPAPQQEQPVYQAPVQPDYGYAPQQPDYGYAPQPPKKSKKGLIIGICAGVVVLAVALILIFTLGGDKDSDKGGSSSTASLETNIVGEWECLAYTESVEEVKVDGYMIFKFDSDKTVEQSVEARVGESLIKEETQITGTYEIDGDKVVLTSNGGKELTLQYRNGKLYALDESGAVVKNGDYDLAFEKK